MDILFLIGRILFAALFIGAGPNHFANRKDLAEAAREKGAPMPELGVLLIGAEFLVGGLMILLGIYADLGALLVIPGLLVTAFFVHNFWQIEDPDEQGEQIGNFLKNIALVGGALFLFYAYNQLQGAAGASLTDPLFGAS